LEKFAAWFVKTVGILREIRSHSNTKCMLERECSNLFHAPLLFCRGFA
jgi:hypothetical protein